MPAPSRFVRFSLLFSLALGVVLLASPSPVQALSHNDHLNAARHKRMIKIYGGVPQKRAGTVANTGAETTDSSTAATPNDKSPVKVLANGADGGSSNPGRVAGAGAKPDPSAKEASASNSASSASSASASPSPTPIIPIPLPLSNSDSASASASDSSSSSISASSTSESSASSTTESSTSTSEVATSKPTETPTETPVTPTSTSVAEPSTATIHVTGSHAPTPAVQIQGAAKTTSNLRKSLAVIVGIGASVAFIAVAWTLFRKWKLRPSKAFDARTAPIDWQPTNDHDETMLEKQQRRRNSGSSFRSFDSQGHSVQSHAPGYGATMPPAHDFTAGPTHLGVNGGYADLQRGRSPSPGPQMMQQNGGYRDYHRGY